MPGDSPRFDLYSGHCESPISTKRRRFTNEKISGVESYKGGIVSIMCCLFRSAGSHEYSEGYGSTLGLYLKGKSAIQMPRQFGGRRRNFTGENFWVRGYFVSTVGLDEEMVKAYIRNQETEDERYDQMLLVCRHPPRAAHGFMAPLRHSPNKSPALPWVI